MVEESGGLPVGLILEWCSGGSGGGGQVVDTLRHRRQVIHLLLVHLKEIMVEHGVYLQISNLAVVVVQERGGTCTATTGGMVELVSTQIQDIQLLRAGGGGGGAWIQLMLSWWYRWSEVNWTVWSGGAGTANLEVVEVVLEVLPGTGMHRWSGGSGIVIIRYKFQ